MLYRPEDPAARRVHTGWIATASALGVAVPSCKPEAAWTRAAFFSILSTNVDAEMVEPRGGRQSEQMATAKSNGPFVRRADPLVVLPFGRPRSSTLSHLVQKRSLSSRCELCGLQGPPADRAMTSGTNPRPASTHWYSRPLSAGWAKPMAERRLRRQRAARVLATTPYLPRVYSD